MILPRPKGMLQFYDFLEKLVHNPNEQEKAYREWMIKKDDDDDESDD